jgi:hypothetical protein
MGKPTSMRVCQSEYIALVSERGELKHLSTLRKRNQPRFPSSGERTGNSLNHIHFCIWGRGTPLSGRVEFLVEQSGKLAKEVIAM